MVDWSILLSKKTKNARKYPLGRIKFARTSRMISSLPGLECFNLSHAFAMEIFKISRTFPKEEKYSLTDQITRASRSIGANIAEGWGKRTYANEFKRHLIYSLGSLEETKTWLLFARDCKYVSQEQYQKLYAQSDLLGAKIFKLYENWRSL
jgi:four helix bundle protein